MSLKSYSTLHGCLNPLFEVKNKNEGVYQSQKQKTYPIETSKPNELKGAQFPRLKKKLRPNLGFGAAVGTGARFSTVAVGVMKLVLKPRLNPRFFCLTPWETGFSDSSPESNPENGAWEAELAGAGTELEGAGATALEAAAAGAVEGAGTGPLEAAGAGALDGR